MDMTAAIRLRRVIARLSRELNATATGEGLTPTQASALALIASRGPLSLAELSDLERLNPTMVSRVVGKLDGLSVIRRTQSPQDLRVGLVEITPEGKALNERVRAERGKVVASCLDRLAPTEREAIIGALPALEALADELRSAP